MDYNFNFLTPGTFEHLVQSLSRKILGNGLITFGDGPDGGREATFDGEAPFPSEKECWKGGWVIQAKFKTREDNKKFFNWVKNEFENEMKKFVTRRAKVEMPDNYLFFTNVVLTPTAKTGGRDKIEELANKYKSKIKNIKIFGYDDLCGFLENNRDVATAYASFILPGDILQLLYEMLQNMGVSKKSHQDLLGRFLEAEFVDDLQSRLDHAGKLTSDKIHLEKVFVDLYATRDGIVPRDEEQKKFLQLCLEEGNCILRPDTRSLRYLLIGGPGFGKSTLTQFLCQVYRAYFLKNIDKTQIPLPEIHSFIEDLKEIMPITPTCFRFPFKIKLKDFAGWITEQKTKKENHALLLYLKYRIEKRGPGSTIEIEDIEQLLKTLSFVFIFDGLDEVPVTSNREDVLAEINRFIDIDLRRYNCDAMVIATTRPQGYTTEFDTSRYTHLTITDLKEEDCLGYLRQLLKAIDHVEDEREGHFKVLSNALKDDIISTLMISPLQASIMAILVKSGGEPPRYKYDLFTEYYNIIFRRERQKNICKMLSENPEYIHDIHYKLGFDLQLSSEQSENPSSNVSIDDFRNLVSKYLEGLELPAEDVEVKIGQILQATTERLVFLEEVEDEKIGFNIRSIQEYFAANYYVQNQPDDIIHKRLKYICKSAYLRNTFLFALGYIFKHKNYMVNYVESICRELNGSTNEPGSISSSEACKLGSWIALDILIEGIFRGYPRFENKFSKLLEDLFTISPSLNHSLFAVLSNDIKQKWIIRYIEEHISQGTYKEQLSGWNIGIFLFNFHVDPVIIRPLIKIFDKYWQNGEDEVKLIKRFIRVAAYDNHWFMSKFLNALKKNSPFTFFSDFETAESSSPLLSRSLVELSVRSKFNDSETKKILIQNLFFLSLRNSYESSYIGLLNKLLDYSTSIFGDVVIFEERNILGRRKKMSLKFSNREYNVKVYSVKNSDKILLKLLDSFSKHNLTYLKLLIAFLVEPNVESLKKFIEKLKDEPNDVIDMVKENSPEINWVLSDVFSKNESLDQIIKNIEQNKFGDLEEWLETERKISKNELDYQSINFLKYFPPSYHRKKNRTLLYMDFFENYYLKFKKNIEIASREVLYKEFVHFTGELHPRDDGILESNEYIEKTNLIVDELLFSFKSLNLSDFKDEYFYSTIIFIFNHATEQKIMNIVQKKRKLLEEFRFGGKYTGFLKRRIGDDIFYTFLKILNINLAIDYESSTIRILIWILLNLRYRAIPFVEINYNGLLQTAYKDPENEACRILLCLFDPDMNQPKAKRMVEVTNQLVKSVPKLTDYIIQLIEKFKIKGDWVEPFLLEIYQLVDKYDHDVKTEFENYLKDMLESLPSHLNEEAVRKELKLGN